MMNSPCINWNWTGFDEIFFFGVSNDESRIVHCTKSLTQFRANVYYCHTYTCVHLYNKFNLVCTRELTHPMGIRYIAIWFYVYFILEYLSKKI